MSSNMERVAAMPDASLYVNRDGERADDCVDSHGGGAHLVVGGSLGIFYSQSGQYPTLIRALLVFCSKKTRRVAFAL